MVWVIHGMTRKTKRATKRKKRAKKGQKHPGCCDAAHRVHHWGTSGGLTHDLIVQCMPQQVSNNAARIETSFGLSLLCRMRQQDPTWAGRWQLATSQHGCRNERQWCRKTTMKSQAPVRAYESRQWCLKNRDKFWSLTALSNKAARSHMSGKVAVSHKSAWVPQWTTMMS
jgi:hypothetical protein